MSAFEFDESKKFISTMWYALWAYMFMCDLDAPQKTHYACNYCWPILKSDALPSRCVLNGLEVGEVPKELHDLDALSKPLIQRAKAFQAVYRLGIYIGKIRGYNSLKACMGIMFSLPLPLDKVWKRYKKCQWNQDWSLRPGIFYHC